MAEKTAKELWQDYRFLTKEMVKFLTKHDMNLFYDLLSQRERLQAFIDKTADDGFKASPEGRRMLVEIKQDSQYLLCGMQLQLNNHKRREKISDAYSGQGGALVSRMNWNR